MRDEVRKALDEFIKYGVLEDRIEYPVDELMEPNKIDKEAAQELYEELQSGKYSDRTVGPNWFVSEAVEFCKWFTDQQDVKEKWEEGTNCAALNDLFYELMKDEGIKEQVED